MWIAVICLLGAVSFGRTENVREDNIRNFVDRNKENFEDLMLRELESTNEVLIFPREELRGAVYIVGIKGEYFISLRDLKLSKDPALQITSLDSTLSLFSTRIGIDFGDIFFTGQIYLNDDKSQPVGAVRFAMKNVRASGHVGLSLSHGDLTSTNYLINYENEDFQEFEYEWRDERFTELAPKISDKMLKKETRKVINAMLKRRFDSALGKMSSDDVHKIGRSEAEESRGLFDGFYDDIVDGLLEDLNKRVVENDMVQITLPDISLPFIYRIMSVNIYGKVSTSNGWLRDLGTFVRRGSVSISFEDRNLIVFGSLGLEELKLGYENCAVTVGGIGPSVDISGTIGNNEVKIAIMVNMTNQSVNLESFEISELSDLDLELTGLGPLNWLVSKIAGWIMNDLITDVVPIIEPMIRDQILEALKNFDTNVFN